MTQPTEEEINIVIAEYMGLEFIDGEVGLRDNCQGYWLEKLYTKSLDALIPVVEKLYKLYYMDLSYSYQKKVWLAHIDDTVKNKSPSMALATVCYKVIKETKSSLPEAP